MTAADFTANELAVLKAAYHSMNGNGFDFGFVDDCRPAGMTAISAGAVLRGLRKKLRLWSDDEYGQLCATWKNGQPDMDADFDTWLAAIKPK